MTFERTHNPFLIGAVIREAFDRPAMFTDGADPAHVPVLDWAQYFAVRDEEGHAIGLFVGLQASNAALELHVCLAPACRGRRAIEALEGFYAWLARETQYATVTGAIPVYNRPMLYVARRSGAQVLAVHQKSTMRNGRLEDRVIFERRIK